MSNNQKGKNKEGPKDLWNKNQTYKFDLNIEIEKEYEDLYLKNIRNKLNSILKDLESCQSINNDDTIEEIELSDSDEYFNEREEKSKIANPAEFIIKLFEWLSNCAIYDLDNL